MEKIIEDKIKSLMEYCDKLERIKFEIPQSLNDKRYIEHHFLRDIINNFTYIDLDFNPRLFNIQFLNECFHDIEIRLEHIEPEYQTIIEECLDFYKSKIVMQELFGGSIC